MALITRMTVTDNNVEVRIARGEERMVFSVGSWIHMLVREGWTGVRDLEESTKLIDETMRWVVRLVLDYRTQAEDAEEAADKVRRKLRAIRKAGEKGKLQQILEKEVAEKEEEGEEVALSTEKDEEEDDDAQS